MSTNISTGNPIYDNFFNRIKAFMLNDVTSIFIKEEVIKGYRSPDTPQLWLRDHTHQMKGFKYWERDIKSFVNHFIKMQRKDGSIYDLVKRAGNDDFPTKRMHRDKILGISYFRSGIEADVEYLLVESAYTVWQVTGDDLWMESILPALEKGLNHSMSDPDRWSKEYQLVKRGFTIDTWDFEYGPRHPSEISDSTHFCIMHGDNSGMYKACRLLEKMFEYIGNRGKKDFWNEKAEYFRITTNKVCWNGKFYTHQVHIDPIEVKGVDESKQLSLSNTYDMNRGIATHEQCVSIIREYQRRRRETDAFAEWFSIDPPFPEGSFGSGGEEYFKPGAYVNGGIIPLAGGELARACFEHGFERYGLDILLRYEKMIRNTGETFLWYYRDGTPWRGPTTLPTDGWGSAAMLYAFVEGLCGVEDKSKLLQEVKVSPRWIITGEKTVSVRIEYGASGAYLDYIFELNEKNKEIKLVWTGNAYKVNFHVLLPQNTLAREVVVKGKPVKFRNIIIEKSHYVDFEVKKAQEILIRYTTNMELR